MEEPYANDEPINQGEKLLWRQAVAGLLKQVQRAKSEECSRKSSNSCSLTKPREEPACCAQAEPRSPAGSQGDRDPYLSGGEHGVLIQAQHCICHDVVVG